MEEETPTNGNDNPKPDKPPRKPSHLPGSDTAPNKYVKSGSEEQFWIRCEKATTLRARGTSYREIGIQLDVDRATAHRMVRRYLQGASRFYPAIELRELLAHALRDLREFVMKELDSIPSGKLATEKRLACISKAESLLVKEAQLYGLIGLGGDINIFANTSEQGVAKSLPSIEDQRRVRKMIREARELMDGKAVEAQFTVTDDGKDKGNGDQGNKDEGGSTPPR